MNESKAQEAERELRKGGFFTRLRVYLKNLGPGLVTGASDDDPSGIGTYSQTGAQFGYTQLWVALFTFPLMFVIQEMCARIAMQSGAGLAHIIRRYYPRWMLYLAVFLLVVANTINLGADLGGMAAAAQLLIPLPFQVWLLGMTALILVLLIFVSYPRYARILRFMAFSLFAYILVIFVIPQNWSELLRGTFIPTIQLDSGSLFNLVALLGTTLSPYLFFWQASQEVEEEVSEGKVTMRARRGVTRVELKWMRADVASGMLLSNAVMWFIIATTASTLHKNGIFQVDSASKAAQALLPIAGPFAFTIFALGIIGTGLLAVPVLAGSAGYAVSDTLKMPVGLSRKFKEARGFYSVIILAMLVGSAIDLLGINPMTALYYSAVLNGLIAPPLMVMLMLIGNNKEVMGSKTNGRMTNWFGWTATALMSAAAIALIAVLIIGKGSV